MNDLNDRLAALGNTTTTGPGTDDLATDDLRRGRRALSIRRYRRGSSGVALAVAVSVTGAYALTSNDPGPTPLAKHQQTAVIDAGKIELVAYTGAQPAAGFRIATIPAGFNLRLQSSTELNLVLARKTDHTPDNVYIGKLVVSLQSLSGEATGIGKPVQVNGQPGTLDTQQGTKMLVFKSGTHNVNVQAWADLGFTDAQLIQFAEGVTATSHAKAPQG